MCSGKFYPVMESCCEDCAIKKEKSSANNSQKKVARALSSIDSHVKNAQTSSQPSY